MARVKRSKINIDWLEKYIRVPEGRLVGQPIKLSKEQKRWMQLIYDSPTRRFILTMGRKNAKTATIAMLMLLHLCGPEAKANSQLYSAAQSRDQAAILFQLAAKMVRMNPVLQRYVLIRDTAKELLCQELGTFYKALSADAETKFGLSPAFVVHDELGQVRGPKSELYEALETASAAHDQPISAIISTQAATDADLLSIIIDDAKSGGDPETKLVMYTAPEDMDPFSDEAIRAANPHFDVFMNKDEVRRQAQDAKRMPSREASYRNLILNQRINQSNPFISRNVWDACNGSPEMRVFEKGPVYLGLDLSARNDLTALVAVAKDEDGIWNVHSEFFAPKIGITDRANRDRAPYDIWEREGILTTTPGASVDYEYVAKRLCEMCDDWPVAAIAFDRWRIDILVAELKRLGVELPMQPFGQGYKDMPPALDYLESELLNKRIRHGGNPIMQMCASNAVATRNPAGDRKLDKSKPTGRIDGLVALAMALGQAAKQAPEPEPPKYEIHIF